MPIEPNFGQSGSVRPNNEPASNRDNRSGQVFGDGQQNTGGVRRMLDIAVGDVERFNSQTRDKNNRDNQTKIIRFPRAEDFERIRQLVANRTPVRRGTFLNIIV